jgi:hypothetical protein
MSPRMPKAPSASSRPETRPRREANVAAPRDLKPGAVPVGLEGLVETLTDLQARVMLGVLEASIRSKKEGTDMPERTLTADAAFKDVTELHDIKVRLKKREDGALDEVADIRARVKLEELDKFDDALDDWLNK